MKCAVAFSFLLACSGVLLGDSPYSERQPAQQTSLMEDLVRLAKAGFSDETILAYAKAHRGELPSEVSTDDLLWLRESGVSETVIRYMAAIEVRPSDYGTGTEGEDVAYDSGEAAGYSSAYPYAESNPYPEAYYNDYYPYFDGGFYYPYPVYFFVDGGGFFGRFHHRGFFHRGGFRGPRFPRHRFDAGFGRRREGIIVGHRGEGRAGFPRGRAVPAFREPRASVARNGGFARPVAPRARALPGFRPPAGGVVRNGGFGRPGFAGGGGAVSRAPVMRSGGGGGSRSAGRPGGIGRR